MANDKKSAKAANDSAKSKMSDAEFLEQLEPLQVALVTTQQWLMETGAKVLIILEGRDAAGKDGTIKRMIEHMSARSTRVVALPKPSDREKTQWHFQRYAAHLPAAGEGRRHPGRTVEPDHGQDRQARPAAGLLP